MLFMALCATFCLPPYVYELTSGDGDFSLHLLLGSMMWEQGQVLHVEPTNFIAPDKPFIAHEWGSQYLYGMLHSWLGLTGPILYTAVVTCSALLLSLRRARSLGASQLAALAVMLPAVVVIDSHLHARPHVVTWLFMLLWLELLEQRADERISNRRWMGLSAVLIVLWTNLHGGFLLAFVLLGLYLADETLKLFFVAGTARQQGFHRLLLGGAGAVAILAASGLNPFGFGLHAHDLAFLQDPWLASRVEEFQSPDFHLTIHRIYLVWLSGSLVLLLAAPPLRPHSARVCPRSLGRLGSAVPESLSSSFLLQQFFTQYEIFSFCDLA